MQLQLPGNVLGAKSVSARINFAHVYAMQRHVRRGATRKNYSTDVFKGRTEKGEGL